MPLVVPRNQRTYTYKGKTHVNPAYRPPPAPRKVFLGAFTVDEVIGSIAGGADAEIMIASRARNSNPFMSSAVCPALSACSVL